MRTLALLAAITMMHTVHALPRPDLAVRQGVNDLSNDRHVFHHLDRNQRTANRDRERVNRDNVKGSPGVYVVKRLADGAVKKKMVDRRFMQGPDYSQGEGSGGGSESASNTMTTQQAEKPGETASSHT